MTTRCSSGWAPDLASGRRRHPWDSVAAGSGPYYGDVPSSVNTPACATLSIRLDPILSTMARDLARDLNTVYAAGNETPVGIWSDDATMWVADADDERLYAYDMAVTVPVTPEQAASDFNGDGIVNFADFFEFVDAFGS